MITPDKEYYRKLITSEYRLAPKFNAMVRCMVEYNCALDQSILKIVENLDLDQATSNQLDIIGDCVGAFRFLSFEPTEEAIGVIRCPPPDVLKDDNGETSKYDMYKTLSPGNIDAADVICDYSPTYMDNPQLLTDFIYKILIKARIIQNLWKGNVLDLYEMWNNLFPDIQLQIQDLQDMSFNIVIVGEYPEIIKELMIHGYIIPKPEGVRINALSFVDTNGLPIFSYNYNTLTYSGYKSHWLQSEETEDEHGQV